MRIDLHRSDDWSRANEQIRDALGLKLQPKLGVQIYSSLAHALAEVSLGLSEVYPHKKSLVYFKQLGSDFDSLSSYFSRKETQVKAMDYQEFKDTKTWLEPIQKDLLFVLSAEDDPVTAFDHDFSFLNESFKDKKFFHLKISHFSHRHKKLVMPQAYEVLFLSLASQGSHSGMCLVISGERVKFRAEMTPLTRFLYPQQMEFCMTQVKKLHLHTHLSDSEIEKKFQEEKAKVLNFEAKLSAPFKALLQADVSRIYDRALFLCENFEASSIVDALKKKRLKIQERDYQVDSISLCHWQDESIFRYLSIASESDRQNAFELTPEQRRSLLIVGVEDLTDAFMDDLKEVCAEIAKNSHFVFSSK